MDCDEDPEGCDVRFRRIGEVGFDAALKEDRQKRRGYGPADALSDVERGRRYWNDWSGNIRVRGGD